MARVRNIKGHALYVPELNRTIEADEVFEIADERLEAYVIQAETWADESGAYVPAEVVADVPQNEETN